MTAFAQAMEHYQHGRLNDALPYFNQALAEEPGRVEVLYQAMLSLVAMRQYAAAATWLDRVLPFIDVDQTPPDILAGFHFNRGIGHEASGHWAAAAACYQKAISYDPASPHAWANLGSIYYRQGRPDLGYSAHSEALAIPNPDPSAKPTLAFLKLVRGDYLGGFADYESRWKMPQVLAHSYRPKGSWRWKGKPLPTQRLLVVGEQGVGDVLQMARYLPWVLERCPKITLICYPTLVRLLQQSFPTIEVVPSGPHRAAQWWVSMMSLPFIFQTTLATIPPATYLTVTPALAPQRRIGWVDRGNALHMGDKDRSAPSGAFAPLLAVPGIDWVDLSHDAMRNRFQTTDFADDAAIIASCERIVSIDSAAAHCAGSLGVPVMFLPQVAPEWRFGLPQLPVERGTPWYPTHTLYRRQTVTDWPTVIGRIANDLR